jgi:isoquinoline 1-oxidoreductase alpha subunit
LELSINGQKQTLADAAISPDMPLLWALRDVLNLTGTKFGCGVAACGA